MFAPAIAFVDLETTGTAARDDRVTEVGIVRIDDEARVSEWSTLVNPECSIPAAIQALTGITNAMVAAAPTFQQIADDVAAQAAAVSSSPITRASIRLSKARIRPPWALVYGEGPCTSSSRAGCIRTRAAQSRCGDRAPITAWEDRHRAWGTRASSGVRASAVCDKPRRGPSRGRPHSQGAEPPAAAAC